MLEVLEVSGLATLQDAGRFGWRRFGVPAAGPMDRLAFEAANLLAGNSPYAAAVELGAGEMTLRAQYDCVLAVTGAGYLLTINGWDFPLWGSCFVRGGWTVRLTKSGFGMWAYLAASGGLAAPAVLGSRSTYLRGRFGGVAGRAIQPGDVLHPLLPARSLMESAGRVLPEGRRPLYGESPSVRVLAGPQSGYFTPDELQAFYSAAYRVGAASDRMGYRLEGPPLNNHGRAELTSEGMVAGAIQVPADGQPIAMMADSATTGGYPKVACVASADLPLLAQCTPGRDHVRFRQITLQEAHAALRLMTDGLRQGIIGEDW